MDQELIAYFDQRFRETSQQIASLREEMNGRFEQVETAIRHTQVEVEGLRSEGRLIAEGIINVDEKLERFRAEVAKEFDTTRSLIRVSHIDLDGRVRALESWREVKDRDPLDLIRERYGNKV